MLLRVHVWKSRLTAINGMREDVRDRSVEDYVSLFFFSFGRCFCTLSLYSSYTKTNLYFHAQATSACMPSMGAVTAMPPGA